jgi:hypothetical protein
MAQDNTVARSLHDLGLAAWFGGSLMGAVGLNGAAGGCSRGCGAGCRCWRWPVRACWPGRAGRRAWVRVMRWLPMGLSQWTTCPLPRWGAPSVLGGPGGLMSRIALMPPPALNAPDVEGGEW